MIAILSSKQGMNIFYMSFIIVYLFFHEIDGVFLFYFLCSHEYLGRFVRLVIKVFWK